MKRKVPFSKPCFNDEDIDEILNCIETVLRSGWLTSGINVKKLEEQFAKFIGAKEAVALNSCTAALHAILLALGIKSGDEVIVPTNTFVATANAVLYVGGRPVFADSDPDTFNISPEDIQNKISRKTKAMIVVHLGGNPCEMKELNELAEDYNIALIEDCAHAHGAKYRGVSCGTFGIANAFSFYPTKVITAAEGGIVTTNCPQIAERIRIIRNHGRAGFGPREIVELGYNYRMSEIHAAIGLNQLKHVDEFVQHRNRIAKMYKEGLSEIDWIEPQQVKDGNVCSYYAYIVKLTEDAPINREMLMEKLNEYGIMTSVLYHPVHLQPFYIKKFGNYAYTLPVAEELGKTSFALPIYNGMSEKEAAYVIYAIKRIAEKVEIGIIEKESHDITYV